MCTTHRPCATVCSPELCRYHRDFEPLIAHTHCRVRFETRLVSAVKASATGWIRCGSSSATMIDTFQPSPAAGHGCQARAAHHHHMRCHFCARRWHRTHRPRLTPSACSRTGSDALVRHPHGGEGGAQQAAASAGTAMRARALAAFERRRSPKPLSGPCTRGRAPAVSVRRGRLSPVKRVRSSVLTSYILGPEVHASVTCVGFTNDPHSLICRKATRLVSPSISE